MGTSRDSQADVAGPDAAHSAATHRDQWAGLRGERRAPTHPEPAHMYGRSFPRSANGANGDRPGRVMTADGPSPVRSAARVDLTRAAAAVAELLDALGVDTSSESLSDTPGRVARAYAELLTPEPFEITTFPNDEGYDELVVARAIPFSSLCEHHLLPFWGVAHVGYLPGDRLVGLSKLARVVAHFSRRLQVQERLTTKVAEWLATTLCPKGVGVVIEAEHACMSVRGVHAIGSRTITSAVAGLVREDERTRAEFFALVGCRPRIDS